MNQLTKRLDAIEGKVAPPEPLPSVRFQPCDMSLAGNGTPDEGKELITVPGVLRRKVIIPGKTLYRLLGETSEEFENRIIAFKESQLNINER